MNKDLKSFMPFNTKQDINNLVKYLENTEKAERFRLKECALAISNLELLEYFFKRCIQKNLYPRGSGYISRVISCINSLEEKMMLQNVMKEYPDVEQRKRIRTSSKKDLLNNKTNNGTNSVNQQTSLSKDESANTVKSNCNKKDTALSKLQIIGNRVINLPLSNMTFREGMVLYKEYIFRNPGICIISKKNRNKVLRTFNIIIESKGIEKTFIFEESEDLKFIIELCRKYNNKPKPKAKGKKEILLNGYIDVPWNEVEFGNRQLYIKNKSRSSDTRKKAFVFKNYGILPSFNDIRDYIERSCKPMKAHYREGEIVGLINYEPLLKLIPRLIQRTTCNEEQYETEENNFIRTRLYPGNSYLLNELVKRREFTKSLYLSFLSKTHLISYKVYYILESVNHFDSSYEEFGYLFTVKESPHSIILLFENITEESRSSLAFFVKAGFLNNGIAAIRNFLSSDMINKRQRLSEGMILKDESIIKVKRIFHTYFSSWKLNMELLYK